MTPLPGNRSFGAFFAAVFFVCAAYAFWVGAAVWAAASLALSALFAIAALATPHLLAPLNRLWLALGLLLGKIVSPIVLGATYFLLITPVAVGARWFGRDVLRLKKRRASTYWIDREPIGPAPDSFKNQY